MARRWLAGNRDLIANTASLIGSAAATSGLGFAFWLVAARLFDAELIGLASAAVSAMLMLSTLGVLGIDALVIGEIGKRIAAGAHRSALSIGSASVVASFATSAVLGLAFAVVAPRLAQNYAAYFSGGVSQVVFAVGVGLTGATFVFDRATIGLLRGGLQLTRNVVFAVAKLVLLPAVLLVPALLPRADHTIYALWAATTALSLLVVMPGVLSGFRWRSLVPDWRGLLAVLPQGLGHSALNLAQHGPGLVMPVLVVWLFPPAISAAFYVTWMPIVFAQSVPANLTTTLYAVGSRDAAGLATKVTATVRLAALASVGIIVGCLLVAEPLLELFGPGYAQSAAGAFRVLSLTVVPLSVKTIYFALARINGFTGIASLFGCVAGIAELGAAIVGARYGSLTTMSWYLLAAMLVEAVVLLPFLLRSMRVAPRTPSVAS